MINYRGIIRKRRQELGISQNKLAKMVGITQPFMNEIESAKKSPSVEILLRICEVLDIKVFADYLPDEADDSNESKRDSQE